MSPFDKALTTWKPISDRLLSARFARKRGHLTIITAYAPTELSDTDTKDDFYNQLAALIQSVPPHDVLAILGDFNAITGVPTTGSNVVGPYGNGSPNDNSDRLTMLCDMPDLTILGSCSSG